MSSMKKSDQYWSNLFNNAVKKTLLNIKVFFVLHFKSNYDRKGRSGGGGAWVNIAQATKHDNNKLVFVQGYRSTCVWNSITEFQSRIINNKND